MSRFFLAGLRGRLLLLVLLAMVPILGLTLYTHLELRRLVVADVEKETLRLAHFTASSQEETIKDTRQLLFALSQLSEVRRADPAAAACSALFGQLLRQYPQYAQLGVVALDGHVFCRALAADDRLNLADQAFFQQTLQTGTFAVSDYQDYPSEPISGKATLSFGYPALTETGQVHAVVFASLDLAWLNQLAAQAQLPEGSTFTVIDRNGTILVRYPDPDHWVGHSVPEAPIVKIILAERSEGTAEAEGVDGIPRQFAFAPLRITPGGGDVFVSVGIPTAIAFANANRVLTQNLAVLALVTLLTLAAAWQGSYLFILRQVHTLVEATKQLSAGNLAVRTGLPYKHGELGQLAQAFDEMAGSLEHRVLERDRAERALQESQRAMATLLSNLPGMAYRSQPDPERTMQFVSEGCLELTGYAPTELTETLGYLQLIHPDDRAPVWDKIQIAVPGEEPFQLIYRIITAAGTEKWVWEQGRGVFSTQGQLIAIEGFMTDTTERVQAYQMLEQRVADRTRELSALYEVTAVASASLNLTTTLERSLEQVLTVMQSEIGLIYLFDPQRQMLHLAVWRGLPAHLMAEMVTLAPGQDLAGWIIEHGEPLVIPHLASDPRVSQMVLAGGAQAFVGAPMRSRGRVLGALGVVGAAGRQFEMEEVALLASIADEVGVAVENAQLYEAERIQRHQADTLLQVASVVSSTLELNEVLARILDQLGRVVSYDSASVQLLAEGQLHIIAARGFADLEQVVGMTFSAGEAPYDTIVAAGKALNLADAPMLYPGFRRAPFSHIHSWLGVPLQVQERMIGLIAVGRHQSGGFAEAEVRLTTAFADQAALALENARLYQQVEQLAVMEERSRLARELHDSVTQSLYSLTLFAEAGRRAAEAGEKERELGYLTRLGQVSHQALKEMRLLVYELRTAALEKEGLVVALQRRLDAVEKRAGIQARLLVEETAELPAMVEEGLYRIAQEALNNMLKHAEATSVIVRLKATGEQVELEVSDNGRAFEAASLSNGGGIGLTSMRERAERLDGSLTIISKPGEGTRVMAKVPTRRSWSRPALPADNLTEVSQ